jgi:hypothetical protein
MPYWRVPSMINVWTKYGKARLYGNEETDLIMKTWHKFNKNSTPWKWGQGQVTHGWLTCTHHDVLTKHGEPRLYASGKSDLFMETLCKFYKASRPL